MIGNFQDLLSSDKSVTHMTFDNFKVKNNLKSVYT